MLYYLVWCSSHACSIGNLFDCDDVASMEFEILTIVIGGKRGIRQKDENEM